MKNRIKRGSMVFFGNNIRNIETSLPAIFFSKLQNLCKIIAQLVEHSEIANTVKTDLSPLTL